MPWPHTERGLHTTTTYSIDQSQSGFYVICVLIGQKRCALGYFRQSVTDGKKTTHRGFVGIPIALPIPIPLSLSFFAQHFITLCVSFFALCIISLLCAYFFFARFSTFPLRCLSFIYSAPNFSLPCSYFSLLCSTFSLPCPSSRWSWIRFRS